MPHTTSSASLARAATDATRCAATWVLLAGVVLSGACGRDATREPRSSASTPAFFGIVSNPVAGVAPAAPCAYVSLSRGTLPSGYRATIRNRGTGDSVTITIVDGGFDPVPVTARAGDALELDVLVAESQAPRRFLSTVPTARRPIVVRTEPRPHEPAAPLDANLVILFSEPIDVASVSEASVHVIRGGSPITGAVRVADQTHLAVEFTPASALAPVTEYRLVISRAVRDRDGDALEAEVESGFTTGRSPAGASAPVESVPPALKNGSPDSTHAGDGEMRCV